jgi:phosphoribosylanthranilate isomerase
MRKDASQETRQPRRDVLAAREPGAPGTYVLWKVCGITDEAGAADAVRAGADALGFIFYPASPRGTTAELAKRVVVSIPEEILRVGVFVNAPPHEIHAIRDELDLDIVQLSGDETPELCERVGGNVWKALRLPPGCPPDEAEALASPYARWTLLLEAGGTGRYGGTGEAVDRDTAASLASRHRVVLAGGLRPENVAEATSRVRPWGVDVASGVETEPGKKSGPRLRAFAEALRPFRAVEAPAGRRAAALTPSSGAVAISTDPVSEHPKTRKRRSGDD